MDQSFTPVKELPDTERPYEKCQKFGAAALSDAELLAVIIRSGTKSKRSIDLAETMLQIGAGAQKQSGLSGLCRMSMQDLMRIKGIGTVKAIQILCTVELSKRIARSSYGKDFVFESSSSVADYYMESLRHLKQEQLMLMMLDTKNCMIADQLISKGTVNSSVFDPRDIFIEALRHEAVNIILIHNHPSGNPTPSQPDILMTKRIAASGKMLGIRLIDHIIIGDNCYESLSDYI